MRTKASSMDTIISEARRFYYMAFHRMDGETRSFYEEAISSAYYTYYYLEWFERDARVYFPSRPDIPILLQEIQVVLGEESGGVRPDKFLREWLEDALNGGAWRYTDQQNKAVRKLAERWTPREKVHREFWFLKADEPHELIWYTPKVLETPMGMQMWLQRKRSSPSPADPTSPSLLGP